MARAPRIKHYHAPGRVNLIGEHTDYNAGFVMPIAIAVGCDVRVSSIRKKEIRLTSKQFAGDLSFPLNSIADMTKTGTWADYVMGVAKEILALGFELKPSHLAIDSSVPTGSGLSSSAALEVSSALALLGDNEVPKVELARLCQRAEREFVGMPCGIMDQYASVFGEAHKAIMLDCRSTTHKLVPIPDGAEIVVVNSMVKHELGSSAYRNRVAECQQALSHFPGKPALRDVTLGELERTAAKMEEIPLARARHVILEDLRVENFLVAAEDGDLPMMGKLMVESHRSLQHDYEVSCEELDSLVDTALTIDGVFGSRMTGGGFGGCTVNLVDPEFVDAFEREISARYQEQWKLTPAIYRFSPSAGARRVE
ncbi:galactokinase [uncultured Paludibaculum sp.]|uniref:galactokinase n=1 Tax=uncultured Paludibaculum sp. TaxID=1765020 RepID=UPI002AAB203B|nr:galactokinase [uncultured Paludibaculum sp.]